MEMGDGGEEESKLVTAQPPVGLVTGAYNKSGRLVAGANFESSN